MRKRKNLKAKITTRTDVEYEAEIDMHQMTNTQHIYAYSNRIFVEISKELMNINEIPIVVDENIAVVSIFHLQNIRNNYEYDFINEIV